MPRYMTQKNAVAIQKTFAKFAKKLEEMHGIKVEFSAMKTDEQTLSFSTLVGFTENVANGGKVETGEDKFSRAQLPFYGLKPDALHETFVTPRGAIAVNAIRPNAKTNMFSISLNGKPNYHCSPKFFHDCCSNDPRFAKFCIEDFNKDRLPRKQRRQRRNTSILHMLGAR